jgi:hypothetical protein
MNYDALSLQAIQWITWISIGVGGGVALCTFIFGMISTASLSKDSTNNPIERLALGFVSRKRYMVLVTLVLLASVYGAASSMNYRATIIHTIVNGAQVIGIPSELLLSADGTPLRVIKNYAMFKIAFNIDLQPIISVLYDRGYLEEPSRANTFDLIRALKQLERET